MLFLDFITSKEHFSVAPHPPIVDTEGLWNNIINNFVDSIANFYNEEFGSFYLTRDIISESRTLSERYIASVQDISGESVTLEQVAMDFKQYIDAEIKLRKEKSSAKLKLLKVLEIYIAPREDLYLGDNAANTRHDLVLSILVNLEGRKEFLKDYKYYNKIR